MEQPGGMCRIGCATLVVGLDEVAEEAFGVPARDAAAEEGLVGETEPPLERWEELQPLPSLVGEEVVEDGIVNEDSWSVWSARLAGRVACRLEGASKSGRLLGPTTCSGVRNDSLSSCACPNMYEAMMLSESHATSCCKLA